MGQVSDPPGDDGCFPGGRGGHSGSRPLRVTRAGNRCHPRRRFAPAQDDPRARSATSHITATTAGSSRRLTGPGPAGWRAAADAASPDRTGRRQRIPRHRRLRRLLHPSRDQPVEHERRTTSPPGQRLRLLSMSATWRCLVQGPRVDRSIASCSMRWRMSSRTSRMRLMPSMPRSEVSSVSSSRCGCRVWLRRNRRPRCHPRCGAGVMRPSGICRRS